MRRNHRSSAGHRRGAYTLLELMLVLAVLVAVAAIAWPALGRSLATQRLRTAADRVHTEWMRARITAMKSGVIQVFRYQSGTGDYAVQRWIGDDAELELSQAEPVAASPYATADEASADRKLPEEMIFAIGDTAQEARAALIETAIGDEAPPILFYPDGTTSDAVLRLASDDELQIELSLRGLTGVTTIGEVFSVEGFTVAEPSTNIR